LQNHADMGIRDEFRNSAAIEKEVNQQQIVKRLVKLCTGRTVRRPGPLVGRGTDGTIYCDRIWIDPLFPGLRRRHSLALERGHIHSITPLNLDILL
jgi:hypothetical protein